MKQLRKVMKNTIIIHCIKEPKITWPNCVGNTWPSGVKIKHNFAKKYETAPVMAKPVVI